MGLVLRLAFVFTWLLLMGCGSTAFSQPPATPTTPAANPTPEPSPTPEPLRLSGVLRTPSCYGGYNTLNSAVTVRDEANNVIGTATTVYAGDGRFLEYETAVARNDGIVEELSAFISDDGATPALIDNWLTAREKNDRAATRRALVAIIGEERATCFVTFDAEIKRADFYQIKVGTHDAPTYT